MVLLHLNGASLAYNNLHGQNGFGLLSLNLCMATYLKDRFNCKYLTLRFGYSLHFAGTNNSEMGPYSVILPNKVHRLQGQ